jgi:ATP-dependent DNA helicase RecG
VELDVIDRGGRMKVTFFNQAWRARQMVVGSLAVFFGPVSSFRGTVQMVNPTVEVLRGPDEPDTVPSPVAGDADGDGAAGGRIYPVYPLTEKGSLTSARIGRRPAE